MIQDTDSVRLDGLQSCTDIRLLSVRNCGIPMVESLENCSHLSKVDLKVSKRLESNFRNMVKACNFMCRNTILGCFLIRR